MTDYSLLCKKLESLVEGVPHKIANLANASALLFETLDSVNWAGFYLLEDNKLILGPFQGKTACIEIPIGRGVCGTAALKRETQLVKNVHEFEGHIACDSASNSEIVVPIFSQNLLVGVLDIDSTVYERFDENDRLGLERFVKILENKVFV
jgi:GAF domain-containing protein